jgi:hypothetical protein
LENEFYEKELNLLHKQKLNEINKNNKEKLKLLDEKHEKENKEDLKLLNEMHEKEIKEHKKKDNEIMNDKNFSSKYSIIKKLDPKKGINNFNSNYYLVNKKDSFLMKEIIPKDKEEKSKIINLIKEIKINTILKIYDEFEKDERLYIIIENTEKSLDNLEQLLNEPNSQEEGIIRGQARPLTKRDVLQLYEKESAMCKIHSKNIMGNIMGTGFFCEIKDESIPFKKALFTNNHILNLKDIEVGKFIHIEYFNNSKYIQITEERRAFTDEKLDYTCIELLDSDGFKDFFQIDPRILVDNNNIINEEIFILQYPLGGELSFSSGRIKEIKEHYLIHFNPTLEGSSGSPLITINNKNLILGLHSRGQKYKKGEKKGEEKERNKELFLDNYKFNLGISFKDIINNLKIQVQNVHK